MDVIGRYFFNFFGILLLIKLIKMTKFIWRPKIKLIGLHDIKNIKTYDEQDNNKSLFNTIKNELKEMKLIKNALKKKQ